VGGSGATEVCQKGYLGWILPPKISSKFSKCLPNPINIKAANNLRWSRFNRSLAKFGERYTRILDFLTVSAFQKSLDLLLQP